MIFLHPLSATAHCSRPVSTLRGLALPSGGGEPHSGAQHRGQGKEALSGVTCIIKLILKEFDGCVYKEESCIYQKPNLNYGNIKKNVQIQLMQVRKRT